MWERDTEEEDEEAGLSIKPNAFSSSSTLGGPKAKKARQQLSLVIQPPVPRFPFVNNFFDVHVFLFDESNQVKNGYVFGREDGEEGWRKASISSIKFVCVCVCLCVCKCL